MPYREEIDKRNRSFFDTLKLVFDVRHEVGERR